MENKSEFTVITAFKLIIFYYLTNFCNIKFVKYLSLHCLFVCDFLLLFKIFFWKDLFHFFKKWSGLSATWILIIKKNILMYCVKGGLHGGIFMKINSDFVYTEREFSKINTFDLSFLFIFLSRWINSNKFEIIHIHKNMETKENCFKIFQWHKSNPWQTKQTYK